MNYTDEQIEQHFDALPDAVQDKVFSPEIKQKVERIADSSGISFTLTKKLNSLVNYVLLDLLSERDFITECQKAFSIDQKNAEELSQIISREIFSPVEAVRVQAMREKAEYETVEETIEVSGEIELAFPLIEETPADEVSPLEKPAEVQSSAPAPIRTWEKTSDTAPDNLPVADEVEPLIPPIPAKVAKADGEEVVAHPFEEKMKKVFTAGQQSMGDLVIEPSTQTAPLQAPPRSSDPYREPIE